MLRKLFAMLLVTALMSVQAQASGVNAGLKAAFDEFAYSVESAQGVPGGAATRSAQAQLISRLESLQAEGVSNQELLDYTLTRLHDQNLARDTRALIAGLDLERLSGHEARALAQDVVSRSAQRGASWSVSAQTRTFLIVAALWIAFELFVGANTKQCREGSPNYPECRSDDEFDNDWMWD